MRVCIYTSIFGGYDTLLQPVAQSVPTDFICFTDAALPRRVGAWHVVRSVARRHLHPRMRAKYYRCLMHRVFPGGRIAWHYAPFAPRPRYDAVIWIDGCLRIISPTFAAEFAAQIGEHGMALYAHPDRDCIYDECTESLTLPKYHTVPVEAQVAAYRAEGFPEHFGLMATTLNARDPCNQAVAAVGDAWWKENLKWSYQDQLSLPVVLWRQGRWHDIVPGHLWASPWFERLIHHNES